MCRRCIGQSSGTAHDLAKLTESSGLRYFGCTLNTLREGGRNAVHLRSGCVAYVEGASFVNAGAIELDLRGQDIQQQSFLGVAFHGVDGTAYDSICFRPFNFRAEDPARRARAVQYVSHPEFPWKKQREQHPGKYEAGVAPVPDPNQWFHARIELASPRVRVFVNDSKQPSLVIDQLRSKGLVGLWGRRRFREPQNRARLI